MAALCCSLWLLLQQPGEVNSRVQLSLRRASLAAFPSVFSSAIPHMWVALAKRLLFAKAGCVVCFRSPNAVRKLLILLVVLLTTVYSKQYPRHYCLLHLLSSLGEKGQEDWIFRILTATFRFR